jgi:hypothetical protein
MPKHLSAAPRFFFRGQAVHFLLLVLLIGSTWALVDFNHLAKRHVFGINGQVWLVIALSVPILHQVFVWLAWRSELCHGTMTKWFGPKAFLSYRVIFFSLFYSRPISLILLTIADHGTVTIPIPVRAVICLVLAVPTAYTGYSVARYFGMSRASGADHFDENYRNLPMVKDGMFRFSSNAMYTYAFLFFWVIAIAGASWAALVVAGFSHAYIWVHYFCTERPDMKMIYGG